VRVFGKLRSEIRNPFSGFNFAICTIEVSFIGCELDPNCVFYRL